MRTATPITLLLHLVLVSYVSGKGAKLKPNKKLPGGKQDGNMFGGGMGSQGGDDGGSSYSDEMLYGFHAYKFRNASHEERLLAYLFRDYDPVARAVMEVDKTVEVQIEFVLLRIHGLDERSQVLTTTGLVIAEWTDERLLWNPKDFGNLTSIIIKADKIWLPELAVMNGADELMPDFGRIRVLLNNYGLLHWEPGGIFRTTCDIDITYFPFDEQHCPLLIGAYSYYSKKMNITNVSNQIYTHDFRLNGEWEVSGTNADWNITILGNSMADGYSHVVFTLHLRRRYRFYIMNIVLPCIMLSVLIMIGFFLPPDAGEKISLGISVLLAFTVFLLMIADNIPRTSLAIPLMVLYLTATMSLGTLSICMTVLVLNVHYRASRDSQPVPHWIRKLVLHFLARLVCFKTEVPRSHEKVYAKSQKQAKRRKKKAKLNSRQENNGAVDDMELISLTVNTHTPSPKCIPRFHTANGPNSVHHVTDNVTSNHQDTEHSSPSDTEPDSEIDFSKEWHELAHVMDRLFFWILFTLMTASAVFILLYPKYTGQM